MANVVGATRILQGLRMDTSPIQGSEPVQGLPGLEEKEDFDAMDAITGEAIPAEQMETYVDSQEEIKDEVSSSAPPSKRAKASPVQKPLSEEDLRGFFERISGIGMDYLGKAAAKHIINTNKHIPYVPLVFRMTQKEYIGGSSYGPTLANVANFKELNPNNNPCPVHCILLNQTNRNIYDPMFELGSPNKEIPITKYFQELVKKDVINYDSKCKELMFDVEYLSASDYYHNRASYPEYDFPVAVVRVNVKTYEVKIQ